MEGLELTVCVTRTDGNDEARRRPETPGPLARNCHALRADVVLEERLERARARELRVRGNPRAYNLEIEASATCERSAAEPAVSGKTARAVTRSD